MYSLKPLSESSSYFETFINISPHLACILTNPSLNTYISTVDFYYISKPSDTHLHNLHVIPQLYGHAYMYMLSAIKVFKL